MGAKSGLGVKLRRTGLLLAGLYLAVLIFLTFFQRRLIYYPTRMKAAVAERWATASELQPWKNSAGQTIGWKRLSKAAAIGQVLIFHGNAGCAIDRAEYVEALQSVAPLDVYILEYPGYGGRAGVPSQQSIFAAANEALDFLPVDRSTYVIGESLGSGVAAYLAGAHPSSGGRAPVAGVLLIAPYNNFATVAREHLPFFPVKWMLRDHYTSDSYLKSYAGPLVVLLAGNDRVVPSHLGRRLFDAYGGRKKLLEERNATHDDIHMIKPATWKQIFGFWSSASAPPK